MSLVSNRSRSFTMAADAPLAVKALREETHFIDIDREVSALGPLSLVVALDHHLDSSLTRCLAIASSGPVSCVSVFSLGQ